MLLLSVAIFLKEINLLTFFNNLFQMTIKEESESSKDESKEENLKFMEYLKKDISEGHTEEIHNGKICILLVTFLK